MKPALTMLLVLQAAAWAACFTAPAGAADAEAQTVLQDCRANGYYRAFHDCDCVARRFAQAALDAISSTRRFFRSRQP